MSTMTNIALTSQQQCTQLSAFPFALDPMRASIEYSTDSLPPSLPSPAHSSHEGYIVQAKAKLTTSFNQVQQAQPQISEVLYQKGFTIFQRSLPVSSEDHQPQQHQMACNALVECFNLSVATHQSSNKPSDKLVSALDEKLVVPHLLEDFPRISYLSSKVSLMVTLSNTIHYIMTAPTIWSEVTNNKNSNRSTDKITKTKISALPIAVLTLETVVKSME